MDIIIGIFLICCMFCFVVVLVSHSEVFLNFFFWKSLSHFCNVRVLRTYYSSILAKDTWKSVLGLVFEIYYEFLLTFSKMFHKVCPNYNSKGYQNLSSRLEDGANLSTYWWLVVKGISIKEWGSYEVSLGYQQFFPCQTFFKRRSWKVLKKLAIF